MDKYLITTRVQPTVISATRWSSVCHKLKTCNNASFILTTSTLPKSWVKVVAVFFNYCCCKITTSCSSVAWFFKSLQL